MKKLIVGMLLIMPLTAGCGQEQEEEIDALTQENEVLIEEKKELQEAKKLYDKNEDIINDATKREGLQKDIAKKEVRVEDLEEKLEELKGNIEEEEEKIKKEKEEGITIHEDDHLKVNYMGANQYELDFYIENKSDTAFELQIDYLILNGESFSNLASFNTIGPNSNAKVKIESMDEINIPNIKSLGGRIELINLDTFSIYHSFEFNDVKIRD